MASKYFAFVYPTATLEHLFKGARREAGSPRGCLGASPHRLPVPHWGQQPRHRPSPSPALFEGIIRDLTAASTALPWLEAKELSRDPLPT